MKEFSSAEFNLNRSVLRALNLPEAEHEVQIDDTSMTAKNRKSGEEIIFSFDKSSYEEEISQLRKFDEYLIVGDDFLNIILVDPFNQLKGINNQIELDGPYKGTIIREPYYGLLFTSLKSLIRPVSWSELRLMDNPIQFSQILRENILMLEVRDLDSSKITDSQFVSRVIASMLAHLSFKNGILLELANDYYDQKLDAISLQANSDYIVAEDVEPLLYFLSAEKISYPHLRFLEYYHVIEYFFLESSIKKIEEIITELFTIKMSKSPTNSTGEYYKGLLSLYNLYGKKEKIGEEEQIKIVIGEILGFNSIKNWLISHDLEIKFLSRKLFDDENTKVDISKVFTSSSNTWNQNVADVDKQAFCNAVANRIYKIRNFIVHTKKGERNAVFTPDLKSFELLNEDLRFVRLLSFRILLARSR